MTEQEQQITIAKACGWREAFPKNEKAHEETKRPGILLPYYWVNEKTHERAMDLPDYLHDLNSMHSAEKTLLAEQRNNYFRTLEVIIDKEHDKIVAFAVGDATAPKRAEAFLRCLNLWKD